MSKFYVYNTIPLYGAKRRNKPGREYPTGSCFRITHFSGSMCQVKPAGKGNHSIIEVRTCFLQILVPNTGLVDLNSATMYDFFKSMGV